MDGSEGVIALFVPIVLFSSIAAVFCVNFYFKHRSKRDFQDTVRAAIQRGQELSPELLDRLGPSAAPVKKTDLRRGILEITIGIGIILCGWVIADDADSARNFFAVGAFPVLLGLAHLALWRFSDRS
jgi:hypothetical protein